MKKKLQPMRQVGGLKQMCKYSSHDGCKYWTIWHLDF